MYALNPDSLYDMSFNDILKEVEEAQSYAYEEELQSISWIGISAKAVNETFPICCEHDGQHVEILLTKPYTAAYEGVDDIIDSLSIETNADKRTAYYTIREHLMLNQDLEYE